MLPNCKNKRIFGIDYTMEFTVIEMYKEGTDYTVAIDYPSDIKDDIICSFLIGVVGGMNNVHINTCIPLYTQLNTHLLKSVRIKNDINQLTVISVGVFYRKKLT